MSTRLREGPLRLDRQLSPCSTGVVRCSLVAHCVQGLRGRCRERKEDVGPELPAGARALRALGGVLEEVLWVRRAGAAAESEGSGQRQAVWVVT